MTLALSIAWALSLVLAARYGWGVAAHRSTLGALAHAFFLCPCSRLRRRLNPTYIAEVIEGVSMGLSIATGTEPPSAPELATQAEAAIPVSCLHCLQPITPEGFVEVPELVRAGGGIYCARLRLVCSACWIGAFPTIARALDFETAAPPPEAP